MSAAEQPGLLPSVAWRVRHPVLLPRAERPAQQRLEARQEHPVLPDRRDDDLRGPHGLPVHQDGLREASLRVARPRALELLPVVWQPLEVLQPAVLPEPLQAALQAPDVQRAALRVRLVSVLRVASPEMSDARRVRDAHRQDVRDAPCRPVPRGARDGQLRVVSARQAVQHAVLALQPEAWAGLDAAAEQPPAPGVQVQPRAAQAVSDVALPAAQHAGPELQLEAREALDERQGALRAAAEQHQPAVQDAQAQRPEAGPLVEPWVRLLLRVAQPAQAGSAHRHSMHEMP